MTKHSYTLKQFTSVQKILISNYKDALSSFISTTGVASYTPHHSLPVIVLKRLLLEIGMFNFGVIKGKCKSQKEFSSAMVGTLQMRL